MPAAVVAAAAAALNASAGRNPAPRGPYAVQRQTYRVEAMDPTDPQVTVTWPVAAAGERFPVVSYAHGAAGGGIALLGYNELFDQIASYGFVVAATRSCPLGCSGPESWGRAYGEEQLKVVDWARNMTAAPQADMPWAREIDWEAGVGVAGHSMGGEATGYSSTREASADRGVRAAAFHQAAGEPGVDPALISVPSIHFTGTGESATQQRQRLRYFEGAARPKAFRNQIGEGHMEPLLLAPISNPALGPYTAAWFKLYLSGDQSFHSMIYGSGAESLCHYAPMERCEALE